MSGDQVADDAAADVSRETSGIAGVVEAAIRDATTLDRDQVAVELVRAYAAAIADRSPCGECGRGTPAALSELGPKLLAALTSLGMTLAGRGQKGGTADVPTPDATPLGQLRARRRRARAGDADTAG